MNIFLILLLPHPIMSNQTLTSGFDGEKQGLHRNRQAPHPFCSTCPLPSIFQPWEEETFTQQKGNYQGETGMILGPIPRARAGAAAMLVQYCHAVVRDCKRERLWVHQRISTEECPFHLLLSLHFI